MTSEAEPVELAVASTPFEAEWYVGALLEHGIEAVAFGGDLEDAHTVSRALMGRREAVRVMVPAAQLERAQQALAEIEKDLPTPEDVELALAEAGGFSPEDPRERTVSVTCPDCGKDMSGGWVQLQSSEGMTVNWSLEKPRRGWLGTTLPDPDVLLRGGTLFSRDPTRQGFFCAGCNNLLVRLDMEPEFPE